MSKKFIKKNLQVMCNILLVLTPVLIGNTASALLWGEPKVPSSFE